MITAVDTNILLDVLIPGEAWADSSKRLLESHLCKGRMIICEVVFSELAAGFGSEPDLRHFLEDTGIQLIRSGEEALFLAGSRWAQYTRKGPRNPFSCAGCGHAFSATCPKCKAVVARRFRVLGDFQVGAHALAHANCLLSRDLGTYRTYFKDLKVLGSG